MLDRLVHIIHEHTTKRDVSTTDFTDPTSHVDSLYIHTEGQGRPELPPPEYDPPTPDYCLTSDVTRSDSDITTTSMSYCAHTFKKKIQVFSQKKRKTNSHPEGSSVPTRKVVVFNQCSFPHRPSDRPDDVTRQDLVYKNDCRGL